MSKRGKVGDIWFLVHHETPYERLTEPIENRIEYIQSQKPGHERETRLKWMRPVPLSVLPAKARKLLTEGDKLWAEGGKLLTEGDKLWAEGVKLRAEGVKLRAEGVKLRAEGVKLRAEGDKLWAEGVKLRAEGGKLRAEGGNLYAEGGKLFSEGYKLAKPYLDAAFQKYIIDAGCPWDAERSTLIFPERVPK